MDPLHLTDILLVALLGVVGYIGNVALETRGLVRELKGTLDTHLRAHGEPGSQ